MIDLPKGLAIVALAACILAPVRLSTKSEPGVVVEAVTGKSVNERAGIQLGDVFSVSFCGQTMRSIGSPFAFSDFRLQRDTCGGEVRLKGSRGAEERIWK